VGQSFQGRKLIPTAISHYRGVYMRGTGGKSGRRSVPFADTFGQTANIAENVFLAGALYEWGTVKKVRGE